MKEYSNDIKSQEILYELEDYVACCLYPEHINIYHYTEYKTPLKGNVKEGWLSCGAWYLREDGKYFDSNNYYGRGLGTADSIEEIIDKMRKKNNLD